MKVLLMQDFQTAASVLKHRLPHSAKPHPRILPQRGISMKKCKLLRFIQKAAAAAVCAAAVILLALAPDMNVHAAHSLPDSSFTVYPDTNIYYSPSVSQSEIYNSLVCWNKIPVNIRQRLVNDGVNIYLIAYQDEVLTSKRVTEYGDTQIGIAGLTTHPSFRKYVYSSNGKLAYAERVTNGMIEIQTDVKSGTKIDENRLVHEVGHYVDTAAGAATATYFAISNGDIFQSYYKAYGNELVQYSSYRAAPDLYNANECWADCFRLACTNPQVLKDISPELYQYVLTEIASIPPTEPSLKDSLSAQ